MAEDDQMVTIEVNGKARRVASGTTVAALLGELGLVREGVAVAVDHRVVPRSTHGQCVLAEGARVEVVQAVGGG